MSTPFRKVLFGLGVKRPDSTIQPLAQIAPKLSGTYVSNQGRQHLLDDDHDELTPIRTVCKACKGHIFSKKTDDGKSYSQIRCIWCTEGAMTGEQLNAYFKQLQIEELCRKYVASK